jgi:hypothetical protein
MKEDELIFLDKDGKIVETPENATKFIRKEFGKDGELISTTTGSITPKNTTTTSGSENLANTLVSAKDEIENGKVSPETINALKRLLADMKGEMTPDENTEMDTLLSDVNEKGSRFVAQDMSEFEVLE